MKSTYLSAEPFPKYDEKVNGLVKEVGSSMSRPQTQARVFAVLDERNQVYRELETNGPDEYLHLAEGLEDEGFKRTRRTRRTGAYDTVYRFAPDGYHETH